LGNQTQIRLNLRKLVNSLLQNNINIRLKAKLPFAIFIGCCFLTFSLSGQNPVRDTLPQRNRDSLNRQQRQIAPRDTVALSSRDSVFFGVKYSKDSLDAQVDYGAADSMRLDIAEKKVYLWGDAYANYTTITLNADYIILDWETSIVTASGWPDSTGRMAGFPEFADGEQSFTADSMRYNFQTRKGIVYDVETQQSDVRVVGSRSKFVSGEEIPGDTTRNDVVYSADAIFTTCTADHPHFGIRSNKQKVVPNKLVIVGPSNLEIMGVPTPLWLPFGFFPLSKGRSTGLLFPSDYEYSPTWGFGLRDIGWFFPMGDHFNVAITSNIYVKGRWGITAASQYRKRYKYSGNLRLGYERVLNENNVGTLDVNNSFIFNWSHRQDRTAHPTNTLGGSINIQTNNYQSRVFNDANNVLQNQLNSNFTFSKNWQNKPLTFTAAFSHAQNTATRNVNITFPNLQFLTQTLYPFRRKIRTGPEKWYETVTFRYTADARATFNASDTTLLTQETLENGQYGMRQTATSGTSFKLFKYFNLNPQVNFDETWYFNTLRRDFDPTLDFRVDTIFNADGTDFELDTIVNSYGNIIDRRQFGFESFREFSASLSLNTQLFGTLQFRKGWLRGLRHVAKVSTSLNYAPDYSDDMDYIRFVNFDTRFPDSLIAYNIFQGGAFGLPPQTGQRLALGYSINNIFEAKIRKDTTIEKIKLFDNLVINGNYNFSADSLQWSPVSINGTARFFEGITTFSTLIRLDPYALERNENGVFQKVDRLYWREAGRPLRFSDANLRFNSRMTVSKLRALFQGKEEEVVEDLRDNQGGRQQGPPNPQNVEEEDFLSLFENFSINHNLVFGWNTDVNTGGTQFDMSVHSINVQGNIQLTDNWRVNIGNFGYDFIRKDFTYPSVGFSRDLHCWEMGMNAQPTRGTYSFYIQVKPGSLGFIKLPYQRNNADPINAFR